MPCTRFQSAGVVLGLLKQAADEEHGRVTLIRTMRSGHKEYRQVELLVDAGLMAWCPDSESPTGGYQAARVTEDGYRLLDGVADPKEGEQRRRRFLEAVGLGVQIAEIAAAVGATLGG